MQDKAHRSDRKWRSALSRAALGPRGAVPVARLAATLAWGANLWLLLIAWPWVADGTSSPWLALAAATPLLAGAALANVGLIALAGSCLLVAFPLGLSGAFAVAQRRGGAELSVVALSVIALGMWVYGAAVSRALRRPVMEEGGGLRLEPLQARGQSPRLHALRVRAGRVRTLAAGMTVAGAAAITLAAPSAGEPDALFQAFGDDPRHAAVLIAMVALAVGAGVVSVYTTALVRPPAPEEQRPFSPMRTAVGLAIALAGAATYYVLRG